MLQKILSEKINIWQKDIHSVIEEKGQQVISQVTVSQAYGGMRGVKG